MSEYIINTDDHENILGFDYKGYFEKNLLTLMGNPAIIEVVRCRDCKNSHGGGTECEYFDVCGIHAPVYPLGFCAWGERK